MIFDTLDYQDIPVGSHQSGLICPQCKGGDRHDRSFFVARNATSMHWFCYRAKCGFVGSTTDRGGIATTVVRPKDSSFKGMTYPIDASDSNYFQQRFSIDTELLPYGAIKFTNNDEYLFAIFNPKGKLRGHVLRQPLWKGYPKPVRENILTKDKPKSMNCMIPGELPLAWYPPADAVCNQRLYIVEDQLSAMRLSQQGHTGVALLGTRMTPAKALEIKDNCRGMDIVIALDPDAVNQAVDIALTWGSYLGNYRVATFTQDPKDIGPGEMAKEMSR